MLCECTKNKHETLKSFMLYISSSTWNTKWCILTGPKGTLSACFCTIHQNVKLMVSAIDLQRSYHTPYQNDGVQGIIQKKSASDIQMLPLVIFEKKYPFCQKYCYFKIFLGKTSPKVPFFKDSRCCPKILDYTLVCPDNLKSA